MKKKSLLCLAGGPNQVNYLRIIKKTGLKIVLVDKNRFANGFEYADEKIIESIYEYKRIIYYIKKLSNKYDFLGVINGSNGFAEISQLKILKYLGLSKIKDSSIEKIFNKKILYKFLHKKKINVPTVLNKKKLSFPLIMKPEFTDIGKILVNYASSKKEYLQNLKKNYKTEIKKKIFLTEYIEGQDFSLLGCIKDKNLYNLAFIEEINHFDSRNRLNSSAIAHPCLFLNNGLKKKTLLLTKKIIKLFDIDNSSIIINFRYNQKKDKVYLIEIHLCLAGDRVLDQLLMSNKFCPYHWYLDVLLKNQIKKPVFKKKLIIFEKTTKETNFKKIFVQYPKTYKDLENKLLKIKKKNVQQ